MKILIIRFSSIGDIVQALSVVESLQAQYPACEVHWLTKSEFSGLVKLSSGIHQIWSLDKKQGFAGLLKLALSLSSFHRKEHFDVIYDAHKNLRSTLIRIFLKIVTILNPPSFIVRSKERWKRFLLFYLKKNYFPKPYRGAISYLSPLQKIGIDSTKLIPSNWQFNREEEDKLKLLLKEFNGKKFIALAPSAAWEMKRWPPEHWKKMIEKLPKESFILLGGPQDIFLEEIRQSYPDRVLNLAGKLTLRESALAIKMSHLLVSADTGLIHMADLMGHKGISLMGPTAFGFCSGKSIHTLEIEMPCRPCTKDGRGKCIREIYQECMVLITPEMVVKSILELSVQS